MSMFQWRDMLTRSSGALSGVSRTLSENPALAGLARHSRSPGGKKVIRVLAGALGVVLLLAIWWAATDLFHLFKAVILPSPITVYDTFKDMISSGEIYQHAWNSLLRVLLGFAAAAIIGIPIGVIMGWVPWISLVVDPVVEIIRPIPPIAWIGLALIWFGIGLNSAVFLVFIGAFFPILLNTISAVRSVDKKLIEVAYTFGANDLTILRKVVMPAAAPTIYTGLRVGMGIGWMCVVAAEMVGANYGLGSLIMEAYGYLRTDIAMVGMISIGLMGLVINIIFQLAGDRIFAWQQGIGKGGVE
jgi:ABC-type nitrate/sulfonate/bicarbonate transport system permease component